MTPPPYSNAYIGIVTENFREAAAFYREHFGFTVNAEIEGFSAVQAPNGKRVLGFSTPSVEKGLPQAFGGAGLHLAFLVEDAEAAMADFAKAGVAITRGIKIENWGEKHFVITDPAGVELYISEAMNKNS